jgi:hypothetical protein
VEELKSKIEDAVSRFNEEAKTAIGGNKAAAARSRKISFEIEKLMKEWRKASI